MQGGPQQRAVEVVEEVDKKNPTADVVVVTTPKVGMTGLLVALFQILKSVVTFGMLPKFPPIAEIGMILIVVYCSIALFRILILLATMAPLRRARPVDRPHCRSPRKVCERLSVN